MGGLSFSLGPIFSVRKISSFFLWKQHKRYSRVPATLQDSIDDDKLKPTLHRQWLFLVLIPPLVYFYSASGSELYYKQRGVILGPNDTTGLKLTRGSDNTSSIEVFDVGEGNGFKTTIVEVDPTIIDIRPTSAPACEIKAHKSGNVTLKLNVSGDPSILAHPQVTMGGYYKPSGCLPRNRVAIIVPYINRDDNLSVFLANMHPFLMNQHLEYQIFIIDQIGERSSNKGRLLNAGFDQTKDGFDCFVFHDINLLPLDERILYTCPAQPRLMSTIVYDGDKVREFKEFFGGVTAMSYEDFVTVNGYSNKFWDFGGEGNDMYWRIKISKLHMMEYSKDLARYVLLPHIPREINKKRYEILHKQSMTPLRIKMDGLSKLKYTVHFKNVYPLFTQITVDINPSRDPVP